MSFNLEFNIDNHKMYDKEKKEFTHSGTDYIHIFPFTTSKKDHVIKDFNNLVGDYFSILTEKNYKIDSKEDERKKLLKDKVDCSEDLKAELLDIIEEFYDNEKVMSSANIDVLITNSSSKDNDNKNKNIKIASYLLYMLGDRKKIKDIVEATQDEYNYNVLEKLLCSNLNNKSNIKSNIKDFKFKKIINSLDDVFEQDFKYIISNKHKFGEYFVEFLEFYYFMYVTQAILQLDKFLNGKRDDVEKIIFFLDWESISATRISNKIINFYDYKEIYSKRLNLFCHVNLLAILNTTNESDERYDYITINDSLGTIDHEHISNVIDQYAEEYKEYFKTNVPQLNDIKKEDDFYKTKTEQSIHYFFKIIKEQFNSSTKAGIQNSYSKHYLDFCDKYVKPRGSLGKTFNITKDFLIMLTTIIIGNKPKIHISELFEGFENRGIYLDKISKKQVIDYFDSNLNIIDSKSDSGEVKYVKRIM